MKNILKFVILLLLFANNLHAQSGFDPKIDKDSLFSEIMKDYPINSLTTELMEGFKSADIIGKEYLIAILYDSNYTKDSLINNYNKREVQFSELKNNYSKLVPKNYVVQIAFYNSKISIPKKAISITIYKIKDGYLNNNLLEDGSNLELISTNNTLQYDSAELTKILKALNWTEKDLQKIEKDLENANSFSIRNGNPTLIQYKRSGMAMLSYKIFDKNLTKQEIIENNDGCNSIYLYENIVLVSDTGKNGPKGVLCFPK